MTAFQAAPPVHDGAMPSASDREPRSERLRSAIVLSTTEHACTVFAAERQAEVPYATPFPSPRAERVSPGHLVAIATAAAGSDVVIWRWFDAVVLSCADGVIRLWEPAHGTVLGRPRTSRHGYRPGGRAYISAGLPGAEWWVAGPVVDRAEDAAVELDEVQRFFTSHGLWDRLT
ncbi:hypothetical protein ACI79J_15345 [Geodermatophilus sp. SYSU D01062]